MASDPDEDIDNPQKPGHYVEHNFAAVRITVLFWTRYVFQRKGQVAQSIQLINGADAILRKYRLVWTSSPSEPRRQLPMPVPQKEIHDDLKAERNSRGGHRSSFPVRRPQSQSLKPSAMKKADRELDKDDMLLKGLIPFDESIYVRKSAFRRSTSSSRFVN